MSTPHISAKKGEIARRVLLPGDPLRAKRIAKTFLKNVVRCNTVRNMLGFTGQAPDGRRVSVSVQGSGMGMPSLSIYVNELFDDYGVEEIIRVGSCGSMQEDIKIGDIVIAQGSCSNSNLNRRRFRGLDFAPIADWGLLRSACEIAEKMMIPVHVGNIVASDTFYSDHDRDGFYNDYARDEWKMWAASGVLAVEMETAELYTLAARKKKKALTILTVSDNLVTREATSSKDRERNFENMVRIALEL
ncbi:MAG: purine-nucleoside phosphorylase [bacterium]|nr:purine-nucleoside phosphorylase [bacterium]